MEWKLFDGDVPHVSTFAYHEHRERAPHAEQKPHKERMAAALELATSVMPELLVDLGCGDGGFLQMFNGLWPDCEIRGFDFQPSNEGGWRDRGVDGACRSLDVFPAPPGPVLHPEVAEILDGADLAVATEVLEHIARPHEVLRAIKSRYVLASSPWCETRKNHDESHAWAWNIAGYGRLFEDAGYDILHHRQAGFSQLILAKRRG